MHKLLEYIPAWNGWIALLLYWFPLAMCAWGYAVRGITAYRSEITARAAAEKDPKGVYYPSLTVGDFVGHVFLILCPIANLGCMFFDVGAEVISGFFQWIGSLLDFPLVPRRKGASK